ncbi:unnamed protein product [Moneuplotes crassus]|uniref:Uncharacterized protein n=1 Tax=Euplotes crassus TaxID=5936 RepID=A0AAD1UIF2_EUPCR|nr:unnamed protein product [Moneuplotes crassus]
MSLYRTCSDLLGACFFRQNEKSAGIGPSSLHVFDLDKMGALILLSNFMFFVVLKESKCSLLVWPLSCISMLGLELKL